MGKIWVEVCLISARGLRRTSSFWKLQWFAVGWIDPNNKYCTKFDASGNANPVWKTKFAALIDDSKFEDLLLHVEVYSRDPLFLREKLQGTATVALKEFLAKYNKSSDTSRPVTEEVGSYQLRKKDSNKPQGFVDISVHISEEGEGPSSQLGNGGEIMLTNSSNTIALSAEGRSGHPYPTEPLAHRPGYQSQPNPSSHHMPLPANYSNPPAGISGYAPGGPSGYRPLQNLPPGGQQSGYNPPQTPPPPPSYPPGYYHPHTPPPPPPPINCGYVPTFIPGTETYVNMPASGAAPGQRPRGPGPGFGVGVGAGALAAGAVIFGDDFMSGFDVPTSLPGPSLSISIDPPF